jgi:hypothetical protein
MKFDGLNIEFIKHGAILVLSGLSHIVQRA